MKRQFMKSLMALCTGVMTLVAASSLFVSCYDDSALKNDINKLDKRLQVVEQLKADLDALTAKVNEAIKALAADGTLAALAEKYGLSNYVITNFN